MKSKYFGEENVFEFIWQHADRDGMWAGDPTTVAAEFNVSEDEAHAALSELSDRALIEILVPGMYAIMRWRERDDPGEDELAL
jgi:hypothetical protein